MLLALILSLIAGLADVLGGFFSVAKSVNQKTLNYFISTSAGFILAVTILDLYPEVIKGLNSGPLLILLGFILIFILENFFAVHAHPSTGSGQATPCEHDHSHEHTLMGKNFENDKIHGHSVWAAYLGFLIHTFFDGAAIAARLLVSPGAGILVFIAVLSHKIPEGFSMASIFQSGGLKRKTAFLGASSLGLATVLGGMVVFISGQSEFSLIFLALATGTFTYITTAELVPYISGTKDRKGILFFLLGILLFYLSSIIFYG
ncbi:MAG: ZIP family metal transporter [Candidatus Daviesbacteria bacterium]|nr:ZIP family metal transporter [Candidatus Daviesbacteria bacterium]